MRRPLWCPEEEDDDEPITCDWCLEDSLEDQPVLVPQRHTVWFLLTAGAVVPLALSFLLAANLGAIFAGGLLISQGISLIDLGWPPLP